ncbi:MAG TPA: hypothetical protein VGN23_05635 [Verrucomicrobiae bacterium]|jgi:hypothetical protein
MRLFQSLLITGCCAFAFTLHAQNSTNAPATEIENFELQTDAVIVKGYSEVGTISTDAGVVSVRCKQSSNAATGRAEYGITVGLASSNTRGYLVVDYDELESLLNALTFFNRITYNVTPMPSFDAAFTTKSGLRISAHSERRQGGIQSFLQFEDSPRISLSSDQFTQFQSLITQAKSTLDGLKNKGSTP